MKYSFDSLPLNRNTDWIDFLFAQASEAKIRANERKSREIEERFADLAHAAFSDILTENSKYASDSGCHILADRWKGMTKDQLASIRHQQLIQIDEHQVHTLADACSFEIIAFF